MQQLINLSCRVHCHLKNSCPKSLNSEENHLKCYDLNNCIHHKSATFWCVINVTYYGNLRIFQSHRLHWKIIIAWFEQCQFTFLNAYFVFWVIFGQWDDFLKLAMRNFLLTLCRWSNFFTENYETNIGWFYFKKHVDETTEK